MAVLTALAAGLASFLLGRAATGSGSRRWSIHPGRLATRGFRFGTNRRERRLAEREAPDLLDTAACLAAAGLPAREALRIAASGPGVLSAAIREACQADDFGAPFLEALEEACERVGIPEGRSVARALRSAETLGASLAGTLREEAARSRERERLRVIQSADALPFKLALVTALFFLPALLVVVFVPSVLNFLERW